MNGPPQPLSYTPYKHHPASHAAAVVGLCTVAAAFAFLCLAILAARHRGPWPVRLLGREPATVLLASASVALAAVASLSALLAWSRRRRTVAATAALAAAALFWAASVSAVVFAGALK
jgi:hypothetical protein